MPQSPDQVLTAAQMRDAEQALIAGGTSVDELMQRAGQIETAAFGRGTAQLFRQFEGEAADGFFGVLDHHLVDAGFDRRNRAAEGDRTAGAGLQAECRQFQRIGHGQRAIAGGRPQRTDARKERTQALGEAGHVIERTVFSCAGDQGLHAGVAAPQIGTAEGAQTGDVHVNRFSGVQAGTAAETGGSKVSAPVRSAVGDRPSDQAAASAAMRRLRDVMGGVPWRLIAASPGNRRRDRFGFVTADAATFPYVPSTFPSGNAHVVVNKGQPLLRRAHADYRESELNR